MFFFFRKGTETETLESIMSLNKEGDINDVYLKLLIMCKNHVAYHLKDILNVCVTSGVYPNIFEIAQTSKV